MKINTPRHITWALSGSLLAAFFIVSFQNFSSVDATANLASIREMQNLGASSRGYAEVFVRGFNAGTNIGGGRFHWIPGDCKPDGGTLFAASGVPTTGFEAGCWLREYSGNSMLASWFGAVATKNPSDKSRAAQNTRALQAGLDAAQMQSMVFMFDQCERYFINDGLMAPLDRHSYQGRPFRLAGCGIGTGYGQPSLSHGTILTMVGDKTLLGYHSWNNHSGSGQIEISNIRFEGTTTGPLVYFEGFNSHSSFHHNSLFQMGTGSGVVCDTCYDASMESNYVVHINTLRPNYTGPTKGSAGFMIRTQRSGGLFKLAGNTSRGFDIGYSLGYGGAGKMLSLLVDHNESSGNTIGWKIAPGTTSAVFTNNYFEPWPGSETVFENNGLYTQISGTWSFRPFTKMILDGPSAKGGSYTNNYFQ